TARLLQALCGARSCCHCAAWSSRVRRRIRRDVSDAVEHPAGLIGRRNQREITHGKPHQPPELIVHAADRVPGGFRPLIDAERQPAVPGKVLQLDRTDEYWRREAFDSVESDVFDSGREL